MVRQGGELQWSKWETGAKAALRPAYGVQVEAITRVLREEEHPVAEPELSARNLNTPEKIEFHKLTMRKFEEWKKGAEVRREIRLTLLDKCTQQVRKVLLAAHPVDEIENLECKVTELMVWLRKAAQDPAMSTYLRKARAMSDYAVAKQFLSETDEAWAERVERLARAIGETGGDTPSDEDIANKFIMSSDASRHSDAIDRHEEQLNMVGVQELVTRSGGP